MTINYRGPHQIDYEALTAADQLAGKIDVAKTAAQKLLVALGTEALAIFQAKNIVDAAFALWVVWHDEQPTPELTLTNLGERLEEWLLVARPLLVGDNVRWRDIQTAEPARFIIVGMDFGPQGAFVQLSTTELTDASEIGQLPWHHLDRLERWPSEFED
ncbi:MAG TPA: hypothetical protein VLI05_04115 [Candidatus Saccharimonadia bacterium]|nr:hypothetical protein [Candidatus Saccharimonadia bacterium]